MMRMWVSRAVALLGFVALIASAWSQGSRAQDTDDLASLRTQVSQLYSRGKYAEAAQMAERYVALARQKHGENHTKYATAISWLASVNQALGRYSEAEVLYKRSLAIDEKSFGPERPEVATDLDNLAGLYSAQGRYTEAEPLFKRALAIDERVRSPDDPHVALSLNNLAVLYYRQGRYAEAEPFYKRSLSIREKALGPDHPIVAQSLNNLAALFESQGRYADAEPLSKHALAIREKALGPEHVDVAQSLNNLAALYKDQGRYGDAEPLYKRALAIWEKALGAYHPRVATALDNLAALHYSQGRYAEAEPLNKRSLAIRESALGSEHPSVAQALNDLGVLYYRQGHYAEAEPLYKRSLAIREKMLGPAHADVARSLNNLAALYKDQGHYGDAEALYMRALAISEKALGADHPEVALSLNNLAMLALALRNWGQAADYWRRATKIIERRTERGVGGSEGGSARGESVRNSWYFSGLVKMTDLLAPQGHADRVHAAREMFETAQWAQASEAASSLAQMAARSAKGDTALAGLVRERQDLVGEWRVKDKQLIAARSQPPNKRNAIAEKSLSDRLASIDTRLTAIDTQFAKDFPEYSSLSSPKPASVAEVQALLHDDEALILFLDTDDRFKPTPGETFVWVVTKDNMRWVRSGLGTQALKREVAALRCGLDYDGTWGAETSRCSELLKANYTEGDHEAGKPLPFDTGRAHALYNALFEQVEDIIRGKQLLIVPSGALTQLPFQVLITANPDLATTGGELDFRRMAWLVRDHVLTVLPSVPSVKALRQLAKASHASQTLIGFGNPLLDGPNARYARWASVARSKGFCPKGSEQRVAVRTEIRRGVLPLKEGGGLVDATQIRLQVPLPETADELCEVARDLGVDGDEIHLGERATEAEIKRLSAAGELAKYRNIHFATHGALAGQLGEGSEPGLLLTPPKTATEVDDGYLSASEIAALKLDADWVILSACNTAAGDSEGAEALSGLARAFFYAGARALLVSHWSVDSDATVNLITGAISRMASDNRVGRAEAIRQSMLAMIYEGKPYEAHPAIWAPFVVVGEGAAR